jgi:hypothetical protein
MKEIKYLVLVLSAILLALLVDEKYDQMVGRRERRNAQTVNSDRRASTLYVAKTAWTTWTNVTPEGNEVHVTLYVAIREGNLQWVVRRDGEYLEDNFEYTTERELSFEEGLALIARQETVRRNGGKFLVE